MKQSSDGPWHISKGLYGREDEITIWGAKNEEGCSEFVCTLGNMQDHDEGNAAIIAAAWAMREAIAQFVGLAQNGKHPQWASYLKTMAGAKMLAALAEAEGQN